MLKKLVVALSLGALTMAGAPDGAAAKTIKVQASSKAGDWTHIYIGTKWAKKLEVMSEGKLKIDVLPTKAVVPHRETMDAVANGILDGDVTSTAYFSGREPAFAIMGDLIAGYDTVDQVQTFCRYGGGKEMLQKIFDKFHPGKIHVIGCGPYSKEAFVSKVPIRTVADFKGVKVRSPEGMAAEVFKRAGASVVSLPFSEVYTALEKNVIDAADASSHVNNYAHGMYKIAKYPLYPGIHSMALLEFIINKKVWDSLSPADQMMLEVWYLAAYDAKRREADLEARKIAAKQRADGDVEIIDWTTEERAKFRKIAVGAWEDFAKKSPLAREALDAHLNYMRTIGLLK